MHYTNISLPIGMEQAEIKPGRNSPQTPSGVEGKKSRSHFVVWSNWKARLAALLSAGFASLLISGLPIGTAHAEQPFMSDAFVDSIGITVGLDRLNSPYYTSFNQIVIPAFEYSGIRHIRWASNPASTPSIYTANATTLYNRVLQDTGVKLGWLLTGTVWSCPNITGALSTAGNSSWIPLTAIDGFEGLNEWDGSVACPNTVPWYTQVVEFQQALYNLAKSSSLTASIPVVGPALEYVGTTLNDATEVGNMTAYMNVANHHEYPGPSAPSSQIQTDAAELVPMNGTSLPTLSSETGYHTDTYWFAGLDEPTQSKYLSRLYFEYFNAGMLRTYVHELIDDSSEIVDLDPWGGPYAHYGLIHSDGTYKPAFVTISNEIAILKDPGSSFAPGNLNYTLTNDTFPASPPPIHHTLLQKRNGTFYLILWQEVNSWSWFLNGSTTTWGVVYYPTDWISIQFDRTFSSINQYDPRNSSHWFWSNHSLSQVTVPVNDTALILELVP